MERVAVAVSIRAGSRESRRPLAAACLADDLDVSIRAGSRESRRLLRALTRSSEYVFQSAPALVRAGDNIACDSRQDARLVSIRAGSRESRRLADSPYLHIVRNVSIRAGSRESRRRTYNGYPSRAQWFQSAPALVRAGDDIAAMSVDELAVSIRAGSRESRRRKMSYMLSIPSVFQSAPALVRAGDVCCW